MLLISTLAIAHFFIQFRLQYLRYLFVKKLSVFREVISEKVPGPKDKKGHPTFIVKTTSFNALNFEATYSEPTKPKSLEQRDHLIEFFRTARSFAGLRWKRLMMGKSSTKSSWRVFQRPSRPAASPRSGRSMSVWSSKNDAHE